MQNKKNGESLSRLHATNVENIVTEILISGEREIKETKNNNNRNPRFSGECINCGKKDHRAVNFWSQKNEKEDDVDNLFMGDTLYGEVLESDNKEKIEEWLGERGVSLHIE